MPRCAHTYVYVFNLFMYSVPVSFDLIYCIRFV